MSYSLSGHFIEACDCTVICPCWVDDDPVGGHCTGLIAWSFDETSVIDGTGVSGCTVVSVSTHSGFRRDGNNTTTVLYIDVPEDRPQKTRSTQLELLERAFSGACNEEPLSDLAAVSGAVVGCEQAHVTVVAPEAKRGEWSVTVRPLPHSDPSAEGEPDVVLVRADGEPQVFDPEHNEHPLILRHTALNHELGVPEDDDVVAQKGNKLWVNVGGLPGGSIEVLGRSGMRGSFSYQSSPKAAAGADADDATALTASG